MGTKHYPVRMFSDCIYDFVVDEKTMKRPQEWPAYRKSQWQQWREDFSIVASKPSPFVKNASRWSEHWQGQSEKDCTWKFAKTEDLFALCSRLFPLEQKDRRNAVCRDLIATADSDPDFFKKTVTGDETWCFAYDPTTKCQSAAWIEETSPQPKKLRFTETERKKSSPYFATQVCLKTKFSAHYDINCFFKLRFDF